MFILLDNNIEKVIHLARMLDDLNGIDKIRLAIYIFESLGFTTNYDIQKILKLLKELLEIIEPNSKNVIINFSKYKNILFILENIWNYQLKKSKNLRLNCYLIFFNMI